jgi:hypothetical protein
MKRILAIAVVVGMLLVHVGCKSEGGVDPQKRQQKISIDVP